MYPKSIHVPIAALTLVQNITPIAVTGFGNGYSANFYMFRATVSHGDYWFPVCQVVSFQTSANDLVKRVNLNEGNKCGDLEGYISFNTEYIEYSENLDVAAVLIIGTLSVAILFIGVRHDMSWVDNATFMHVGAAAIGIWFLTISQATVDHLK
jgi:hypothetical protein